MMRKTVILLTISLILFSCNQGKQKQDEHSGIIGCWAFLDGYGNYNEAYFQEHSYLTVNRFVQTPPSSRYQVVHDTLLINTHPDDPELTPIANLIWIDENHVVIHNPYVSDTLERISDNSGELLNLDPKNDSAVFWNGFYDRYEKFLIRRGIITEEEVREYRENKFIPEDVKSKAN
ncbi:MAG: hypothetical protein KDC09_11225 [Bacteroidales bacterium]|nr:hypothetical protein [Bacteroidales bacterium]